MPLTPGFSPVLPSVQTCSRLALLAAPKPREGGSRRPQEQVKHGDPAGAGPWLQPQIREDMPYFLAEISACAFAQMFLIKPPFSAPSPGRLLSYGQIKEKEDSKEARRSQSEADAEGVCQELEKGTPRQPRENFQVRQQEIQSFAESVEAHPDKSSRAQARFVHARTKGETSAATRCHG